MADPVTATVAAVGMGSTALGGVVDAFGSLWSGEAKGKMADYQAAVAQQNAQIQRQNAAYARYAGEVEAQQAGMKTRSEVGAARATQGASGLDVNSGSTVRVRNSIYNVGEENIALIRSNAAKVAYGYEVEATSQAAQSQLYKMQGDYARTAGEIGAVSSILGSAGKVGGQWMQASKAGVFT